MKERIRQEINKIFDELIQIRRYFHRFPELGFQEVKTSEKIAQLLEKWGLEVQKGIAKTGVVGLLKGSRPGKTLGIRSDIDALPIVEQTGLEFASEHSGIMHACGHDGHIAIALGTARVLSALKDQIAGNVKFIFQPAEEGPGGAEKMIEEGILENPSVDAIIGLHIWPEIPSGSIGISKGPIMAAADRFDIKIIGVGGHGAVPHKAVDPVVIGSEVVVALQNLISREIDPLDSAVISIGTFQAGSAFNIIPKEAELSGTVRTFNPKLRELLPQRIEEIVAGITKALRAEYEYKYHYYYPVTINDPEFTEFFRKVAVDLIGADRVREIPRPSMGGEDFSFYLQKVPGTFFFLGTRNEKKGLNKSVHHPEYTIDEDILPIGVELFCGTALTYLKPDSQ
ncbi:peptidase M20 [Anoxybacter fermentans]|uniref:Peptidase M20 n=1 Tax=Anoxybacter fermentans TaxID=1323375 RepID=A0A3S9SY75_9FIRM|nr:amidohydrolase [Anoxybacter fermentans]AZR73259.1 peptidase M20 [Anoxybacter fermentans]